MTSADIESRLDTRGQSRHRTDEHEVALRAWGIGFDGKTSHRRRVRLRLSSRSLRVFPDSDAAPADAADTAPRTQPTRRGAGEAARYRLADLQVGERWDHAPMAVALPDGGTVWIDDEQAEGAAFAQALTDRVTMAHRKARRALPWPGADRIIASWPAVIACLLATIVLLAWFDRRGAAMVATTALRFVPTSVDQRIGDAAWTQISREWLTPTQLGDTRQLRLVQRFKSVAGDVAPGTRVDLRFHRMGGGSARSTGRGGGGEGRPGDQHDIDDDDDTVADTTSRRDNPKPDRRRGEGGFNAFAVPNGTIVVLDGLANTLTDDELMAVLGHELGHVVHRHSMKGVMRSLGLLSVASVVFGDFSSVLASSVATMQTLHYSRDDEREADTFGRRFAAAANLPAGTEASVWRKFQKEEKRSAGAGIPPWLSTHPPTEERLKAAEEER